MTVDPVSQHLRSEGVKIQATATLGRSRVQVVLLSQRAGPAAHKGGDGADARLEVVLHSPQRQVGSHIGRPIGEHSRPLIPAAGQHTSTTLDWVLDLGASYPLA